MDLNIFGGCDAHVIGLQLTKEKQGDKCIQWQNNCNVFWKKMWIQDKPCAQATSTMIKILKPRLYWNTQTSSLKHMDYNYEAHWFQV